MIETVIDMRPQVAAPVQMGFDYSQIDEGIRDEVKQAAIEVRGRGRIAVENMLEIGKHLLRVKALLPHGQFQEWVVAECQFGQRIATRMMNSARLYGDKKDTVSGLNSTIVYLLSAPSTPDEVRTQIEGLSVGEKVNLTTFDVKRMITEQETSEDEDIRILAWDGSGEPEHVVFQAQYKPGTPHAGEEKPCSIEFTGSLPPKGTPVVYGMIDPRNDTVYYIGSTLDFRARMYQHARLAAAPSVCQKHEEIYRSGLRTQSIVLAVADDIDEVNDLERRFIQAHVGTLTNRNLLFAAPGYPEDARVEVEQAAIEGKKVTVEFAKEAKQKRQPDPVQYAPVYALESKVGEWLRDVIGETGTPNAETVLANVKLQLDEPHSPGNWLDMLETYVGNALTYRKKDLHQAINNVREQRRVAARQAQARKVYVEPVAKAEPEMIDMPVESNKLQAAGFRIQKVGERYRYEWKRDGMLTEHSATFEFMADVYDAAFARLAKAEPDPDEAEAAANSVILTREWIAHVLERYNPANADFDVALKAATLPELQDAMATLWPDEPHHRERCAKLKARMVEFAPAPQPAPELPALVELMIDPLVDETTMLPNSLHWAIKQATATELNEALRLLPDSLTAGRGPVLEAALKKRGGVAAMMAERASKRTPDPRLEDARALVDLLVAARDTARAHYGELTGQHTDMLEFERGVAAMLPPLERLIAVLEGTE